MHFFEFKVDSDDMCQSIVLYTTLIYKYMPTYPHANRVTFQIDLEKLEDMRNRVAIKKRQRLKYT